MVVKHIVGNIFHAPVTHAIAHCVAEDLHMNKGFAKIMKDRYGSVDVLQKQKLNVGDVGVLTVDRIILVLVSKIHSYSLTSQENLKKVFVRLREVSESMNILNISCPLVNNCIDKINNHHMLNEINTVFKESKVTIYMWRWKYGNCNPSYSLFLPNVMLAGDSNFLRVLDRKPGTRQGHVISGGNLFSIQYSLRNSLPKQNLFFMAGTNDLIQFCKDKLSRRAINNKIQVMLRKLMKTFGQMVGKVTILTIPPCPLLDENSAVVNVDDFNKILQKFTIKYGFSVLDVIEKLKIAGPSALNSVDKVHLTKLGVDIVRQAIIKFVSDSFHLTV